jgi:glycosyltransferase involved in cell wall biosynthesis
MIIGGAQENTLYNCRDLAERHGDEVVLFTGPAVGPEGDLLGDLASDTGAGQGRGGGAGSLRIEYVPSLKRSIDPLRDPRAYFELRQALAAFKPDVVHTHSAKGGFLGRLAAWSLKVPAVVHTVHGAPFHPYQAWPARRLFEVCERYAARRCHALISVAHAMTDLMVSAKVAPREKFTTIYSGMEVEPFLNANQHRERMRREFGFGPEQVVIGKIARLFHLKGHEDVIAAAEDLRGQKSRVRFLFIGDGILRERLERDIRARGLEEMFVFAGLVPPARIPEYLGAMDILVHTSLREGLARALPQALLAGKPVVSYDVDGAREVCVSGETGFLVPPRDFAALKQALVRLVGDAALREKLGATGRARCEGPFRHEVMTERVRELYLRLLAGAGEGSK